MDSHVMQNPAASQVVLKDSFNASPPASLQYTEREGLHLGLVGWVKNTYSGTVVGQVQGSADMVEEMKVWLSKEGSPSSRITKAVFTNQRSIDKLELSGFKTRF
ncbi:hypothetical protein PAMA_002115 [Pampus argenteus]